MNCVLRNGVYAFVISFLTFSQGSTAFAKGGKESAIDNNFNSSSKTAAALPNEFKWNEHGKLTWDDFRGPVRAASNESAAATNCGIAFKTVAPATPGGNPQIVVYNEFYANRSWVRPDAHIASVLDHEQGHFDLCEIYTRKLRQRMQRFSFDVADVRGALMAIYNDVSNEYELRQQAYEHETVHGTNIDAQKKWEELIAGELASNSLASNQ